VARHHIPSRPGGSGTAKNFTPSSLSESSALKAPPRREVIKPRGMGIVLTAGHGLKADRSNKKLFTRRPGRPIAFTKLSLPIQLMVFT